METINNEKLYLDNKAKFYMLNFLVKFDCFEHFMKNGNNCSKVAEFLGFRHIIGNDNKLEYEEFFEFCKIELNALYEKESQGKIGYCQTLNDNLHLMAQTLHLNDTDLAILELAVIAKKVSIFDEFLSVIDEMYVDNHKSYLTIANILNCEYDKVAFALSRNGMLIKMVILRFGGTLKNMLSLCDNVIKNELFKEHNNYNAFAEIFIVLPCNESTLNLNDYAYIKDINMLVSYLKNTKSTKQKGVNILLYGSHGSGKTELAKVIAKNVGANLYHISINDGKGRVRDGADRINSYRLSQDILNANEDILLYDKAEDALSCENGKLKNKAFSVEMLKNNAIPTIWITNSIDNIDKNILGDIVKLTIKVNATTAISSTQETILNKICGEKLDQETRILLKQHSNINPAIINKANEISSVLDGDYSSNFLMIVNNALKAQGHCEINKKELDKYKSYSLDFIHTDIDIERIVEGLKKNPEARILLYGLSGTGKSAFAEYIAKTLGLPCIIKTVSDLEDSYVGDTEKNIAKAFAEAKNENAVLVFDEADSFLYDRSSIVRNWERTKVNEMLIQLQRFDGIFIATTNLMDDIDQAALRRFDEKIQFKALKPEQRVKLYEQECAIMELKYNNSIIEQIAKLEYLTPGDFATVKRQNKFNPIKNAHDFYKRLCCEVKIKNLGNTSTNLNIGFLKQNLNDLDDKTQRKCAKI